MLNALFVAVSVSMRAGFEADAIVVAPPGLMNRPEATNESSRSAPGHEETHALQRHCPVKRLWPFGGSCKLIYKKQKGRQLRRPLIAHGVIAPRRLAAAASQQQGRKTVE
jgi:hypothetical protein